MLEDETHPMDLNFSHCVFNNHHNARHRLKAQTLQPNGRDYLMQRYFASNPWPAQPTTYANVPQPEQDAPMASMGMHQSHPTHHANGHHQRQPSRHSHRSHNHQGANLHARSHSQHHYHQPMLSQGLNDPNCYINVVTPVIARSRHSPINEPLTHPIHSQPLLDCITVMQVCNELGGNIDSSPQMPSSRKYSISKTQGGYFKIDFPQTRTMQKDFHDRAKGISIRRGETISVMCPAKEDRSKFTVCYNGTHIDVPHQYTLAPPFPWNIGYNQGYVDSHNLTMRH